MDQETCGKQLLDRIMASIKKHDGERYLSSVILSGSFGRNEPTYSRDYYGNLKLKSDVEIVLLFPDFNKKKKVKQLIRCVSSEFKEDLNLMAIHEKRVRKAYNFNYSLKIPKYKTIFTYDLFNGSQTIWGKDFLKRKEITITMVDPYEAKRLVANRIGELTYLRKTKQGNEKDYLKKQWKGKLVLAIGSAWLIGEGKYVSSYHRQYDNLENAITEVETLLGSGFFDEYKRVFSFLRECGDIYEIPDVLLRAYVKKMDQYFKEKRIKNPKVNSISRELKYIIKYLRTGMRFGINGFEDNILQALIEDYWSQSNRLNVDADVWHNVLY